MDLKNILKTLKLNESTISTALGAVVIVVVALLVASYFRNLPTKVGQVTSQGVKKEVREPNTHTVSKGETLWSISESHFNSGYNWTDIAAVNGIKAPYNIEVGQTLNIPDVVSKQETTQKEVVQPQDSQPIAGATYTVSPGDTLWDIAVRSYGDGYMWTQIAQENALINPNVIHSGNVLSLPQ